MPRAWPVEATSRAQVAKQGVDRSLAELSAQQHGVVSIQQVRDLGLSSRAAANRLAVGRLHPVHRGVYSVGHRLLTQRGRWMAGVLACGASSALSHRSMAAALHLTGRSDGFIHVTSPGRAGRVRPGVVAHSAATLLEEDRMSVDGIPGTTVARTLLDLAEGAPTWELVRALKEADRRDDYDAQTLLEMIDRLPGRRGGKRLRPLLARFEEAPVFTRSGMELRFYDICGGVGIPRPVVNSWVSTGDDGFEVDFLWPERRLIVETDAYGTHGDRMSFERDRERLQILTLAGYRPVLITWIQIFRRPEEVASRILRLHKLPPPVPSGPSLAT